LPIPPQGQAIWVHCAPSIDGRDNSCKFRGVNGGLYKNVINLKIANCIIAISPEMRFDLPSFKALRQ
ncbi:MAG: hypothetical protein RLN85_15130, partial [Pseudomonadales bacterium]